MNPLMLKWIVGLLLVASIFGAGDHFGSTRVENKWLKKEIQAEKSRAEDALRAQGVSSAYQLRLQELETAARNRPARVVRLCDNGQVPVSDSSGGLDGASEDGVSRAPGPDIGPGLTLIATDADKCAAQLSALQEWVRTVALTPGK